MPDRNGREPTASGEGTSAVEARAARAGTVGGNLGLAFGRDGSGARAILAGGGDDGRGRSMFNRQRARGAISASVSSLVQKTIGSMMMVNGLRIGLMVLAVGLPAAAAIALSQADDSQVKKRRCGRAD